MEGNCLNRGDMMVTVTVSEGRGSRELSGEATCGDSTSRQWDMSLDMSSLDDGVLTVGASVVGTDGKTHDATDISFNKDTVKPQVGGLFEDQVPKKSKSWEWECEDANDCSFRHIVTLSNSHSFSDYVYGDMTNMSQGGGTTGTYYLHVQGKDAAGNESDVKSVSALLDNTASRISSVIIASKAYPGGAAMDFRVVFNEVVEVTGTPRFGLTLDDNVTRYANYERGGGGTDLIFRYVVARTDSDSNGIEIPTLSLDLTQGPATIQDQAENDVITTFTMPTNLSNITLDGMAKNVVISETHLTLGENGATETYTVKLNTRPSDTVTVSLLSGSVGVATVLPSSLSFTTSDWETPLTVTVRTVNDDIDNNPERTAIISHTVTGGDYAGLSVGGVTVTAEDDDVRGLTFSQTTLGIGENGATETYTVKLNTRPTDTVTVSLLSGSAEVATVLPSSLSFTTGNWETPQTVTVRAVNDDIDNDPNRTVMISHTSTGGDYAGLDAKSVTVTAEDDDVRGLALSETTLGIGENGATETYTVRPNTRPTDTITVSLLSGSAEVATVLPSSLRFTTDNWETPQTVTVRTVNDDIDNDPNRTVMISHTVTGGDYAGLSVGGVTVTAEDDDVRGLALSETTLGIGEGGAMGTYTVRLESEPTGDVTVTLSSGDSGVALVSPSSLSFRTGDWNTPQTVTVTTVDDSIKNDPVRTATISHTATGGGYTGLGAENVTVTATDDDVRGLTLSSEALRIVENGATETYTVRLNTRPTGEVTVAVSSDDTDVATVLPPSLSFTTGNWETPLTVTVTTVDDSIDNDPDRTATISHTVSGLGTDYESGVSAESVTVTATDDDSKGVSLSSGGFGISENGMVGTYTVVLNSRPTAQVTVTVSSGDNGVATVNPSSLYFTVGDWNKAQLVRVTTVDDNIQNNPDRTATISHGVLGGDYEGVSVGNVTVTARDDDSKGVFFSKTTLSVVENDGMGTYGVHLKTPPTGEVTVSISNGNTNVMTVSPSSLSFSTGNWNASQTVTVRGVNDNIDNDPDRTATISHTVSGPGTDYESGVSAESVTVTATDDDTRGVGLSTRTLAVGENDQTQSYTVVLDSEPTGTVTVNISSGDTDVVTVSPASLSFSTGHWSDSQTVTVRGVNDDIDNDPARMATISHTVSGAGTDYVSGVSVESVTVTSTDDETKGVSISTMTLAVGENDQTQSYTVVLDSEPTGTGTVTVSMSNGNTNVVTVSPSSLSFSTGNWSDSQTVTVRGVNDNIDNDPARMATISHTVSGAGTDYASGVSAESVTVTSTDDETKGVGLSTRTLAVGENAQTQSYTVVLDSEPTGTGTVTVSMSNGNTNVVTVSPSSLSFSTGNWSDSQTVTVRGVNDDIDNDPARMATISHTVSGAGTDYASGVSAESVTVTSTDDETRGVSLSTRTLAVGENAQTQSYTVVLDRR